MSYSTTTKMDQAQGNSYPLLSTHKCMDIGDHFKKE